ncbi:MAG: glycosyltransferase family 4 protein [Candidatus Riflebacteria bacterium]|nr:glycosyltransferase family 4 protein [Candidatus Riflebacteria bacterium]
MKILIISNLYPPHYLGGYEILCAQVVESFIRSGHEITVLTSNFTSSASPSSVQTSEKVHGNSEQRPEQIIRKLTLYPDFGKPPVIDRMMRLSQTRHNRNLTREIIAKGNFDAIFIWSQLRLSIGCAAAAEESGIKVFYTFNDEHIIGYKPAEFSLYPIKLLKYLRDRYIFQDITFENLKFQRTTCISATLKNNLLRQGLKIPDSKVIFQGIPVENFPCKENSGEIHSPLKLLYAGQLHEYKGVHVLLEAAAKLVKIRQLKLNITIAGDGPAEYKSTLNKLAKDCACPVEFCGRLPHSELPALYRNNDIFIFPSLWQEPFGLTHLEAMASGTPVVSTNDGGHGEFLKNHENSLIFEKGNSDQLADCIFELVSNDTLRSEIIKTARNLIDKTFSIERYAQDLLLFIS